VRIRKNDEAGGLHQFWESNPLDAPDGFSIGRSGDIYVALTLANQIAVISPQGTVLDRFPDLPLTGDNGSPVPFDNPSSTWFDGKSLVVANQSFVSGNPANQAVLKVFVGQKGQPELIPRNAGLRRH
jgi:hypothetical protein